MKTHLDVKKVVQELAESIRAKTWVELEPSDPPSLFYFWLNLWLEDLENYSGRVPVCGPIVIQEKEIINDTN